MTSPAPSRRARTLGLGAVVALVGACGAWRCAARPVPFHAAAVAERPAVSEGLVPDAQLVAHLAAPGAGAGPPGWSGTGCDECHAPAGGPHGALSTGARAAGAAYCAACHQGGPTLAGKPLRDSVEEWRRTPAAAAGRSCVDCHLHDGAWVAGPTDATVAAAFAASVKVAVSESGWGVGKLKLTATDAVGHRLPTGADVGLRLSMVQVDHAGLGIEGTRAEGLVGREVAAGVERSDTRLWPGEDYTLGYAQALHDDCTAIMARVEVVAQGRPTWTAWEQRVLLLPE